jgi:hypothetical protein
LREQRLVLRRGKRRAKDLVLIDRRGLNARANVHGLALLVSNDGSRELFLAHFIPVKSHGSSSICALTALWSTAKTSATPCNPSIAYLAWKRVRAKYITCRESDVKDLGLARRLRLRGK